MASTIGCYSPMPTKHHYSDGQSIAMPYYAGLDHQKPIEYGTGVQQRSSCIAITSAVKSNSKETKEVKMGDIKCRCYINHGNGDVEEIVQCPLCKSAPALYEACEEALDDIENFFLNGDSTEIRGSTETSLGQALAKAKGR